MYYLRGVSVVAVFIVLTWYGTSRLYEHLDPNTHKSAEQLEDARWIATSKWWLDRQTCRWLGLCGLAHWQPDPAVRPWNKQRAGELSEDLLDDVKHPIWEDIPGTGQRKRPSDWHGDSRVLKEVPKFVLDAAPLIHLYSGEQFWPSDIAEHVKHMQPYSNFSATDFNKTVDLNNMAEANEGHRGRYSYMHSKDDVEERPDWLGSAFNKPVPYDDDLEVDEDEEEEIEYTESSSGETPTEGDLETWFDPAGPKHKHKSAAPIPETFRVQPTRYSPIQRRNQSVGGLPVLTKPSGYSPAPVILVIVDKGDGIVDAFWFYFYSYNLGTTVLGIRFGNHVGDWEHSLIRFHNGIPKAVFFSAHSGGIAYKYSAVEKGRGPGREGRPVLYSALGSHAMYAQPGKHPYVLPFGMLADVTDRGPLWDPALNYLAFHYHTNITHNVDAYSLNDLASKQELEDREVARKDSFQPAASNPSAPVGWWWFDGHWGDKFYQLSDIRQWRFAGQYHYVNGPYGPRFKNLGRSKVCQSRGPCTIVDSLSEGKKRTWIG